MNIQIFSKTPLGNLETTYLYIWPNELFLKQWHLFLHDKKKWFWFFVAPNNDQGACIYTLQPLYLLIFWLCFIFYILASFVFRIMSSFIFWLCFIFWRLPYFIFHIPSSFIFHISYFGFVSYLISHISASFHISFILQSLTIDASLIRSSTKCRYDPFSSSRLPFSFSPFQNLPTFQNGVFCFRIHAMTMKTKRLCCWSLSHSDLDEIELFQQN